MAKRFEYREDRHGQKWKREYNPCMPDILFHPVDPVAVTLNNVDPELTEALEHARSCINNNTTGVDWQLEELSFNIESNFPDLSVEHCDWVAELALAHH